MRDETEYPMRRKAAGLPRNQGLMSGSHALRTALLVLLALAHDGGAETRAEIFGQFVELRVAIDLYGFLGGVANDVAVVTPGKMIF